MKWINISKFFVHEVLRRESMECPQLYYMDGFDWFNAQISNDMLGTYPNGGHSASSINGHNES